MKYIKDSFFTIGTRFLLVIVGLFSSIVLARLLGPIGRGQWAQLLLPVTLMFRVLVFGLPTAQIYCANKLNFNKKQVFSNVLSLIAIFSIISIPIYLFGIRYLYEMFFSSTEYRLIKLACILVPVEIALLVLSNTFLINRGINSFILLQLLRPVVFIILLLTAIFLIEIDVHMILTIYMISLFIIFLVMIYMLLKAKYSFSLSLNFKVVKSLLRYGLKDHLGQIFIILNERIDLWIISYFLNISQVGIYSIALVATRLIQIPDAIGMNLFPVMTIEEQDRGGVLSQKVLRVSIAISVIMILPLFLVAKPVINFLYGNEFLTAVIPFVILLPLTFTNSVGKVCRAYLSGNGLPQIASFASGVSLVVSIFFGIVFIKRWGIVGAALTATTSSTIYAGIMFIWFIKVSNHSVLSSLIVKPEDLRQLFREGAGLWKKLVS